VGEVGLPVDVLLCPAMSLFRVLFNRTSARVDFHSVTQKKVTQLI